MISYIGTLIKVQFMQDSCLFSVWFMPSLLAKGYIRVPLLSTLGGFRIHFEIRAQCHLVDY
jgi:hypothetical protein